MKIEELAVFKQEKRSHWSWQPRKEDSRQANRVRGSGKLERLKALLADPSKLAALARENGALEKAGAPR